MGCLYLARGTFSVFFFFFGVVRGWSAGEILGKSAFQVMGRGVWVGK